MKIIVVVVFILIVVVIAIEQKEEGEGEKGWDNRVLLEPRLLLEFGRGRVHLGRDRRRGTWEGVVL